MQPFRDDEEREGQMERCRWMETVSQGGYWRIWPWAWINTASWQLYLWALLTWRGTTPCAHQTHTCTCAHTHTQFKLSKLSGMCKLGNWHWSKRAREQVSRCIIYISRCLETHTSAQLWWSQDRIMAKSIRKHTGVCADRCISGGHLFSERGEAKFCCIKLKITHRRRSIWHWGLTGI